MSTEQAQPVEVVIEDGPRALPKDQALALFSRWYDEHQGDEEATFTFQVTDGGRKMEVLIGERLAWGS